MQSASTNAALPSDLVQFHLENGVFFANRKSLKGYKKDYVLQEEVYELTRYYKTSKANPSFSRTIITVKAVKEREPKPWYLVLYKWAGGPKEFILQRHGNAMKPTASAYFQKDPVVSETIDECLDQGLSVDSLYATMSKQVRPTVSETISGPKMIENLTSTAKRNPWYQALRVYQA